MDVELTIHAMEMAEHIDHLVLYSGDGNFQPLAEAVQRRGVRVTVVSTIISQPPVADELRRQADDLVDIIELQPFVSRDPVERPVPRDQRHYSPQLQQRENCSI